MRLIGDGVVDREGVAGLAAPARLQRAAAAPAARRRGRRRRPGAGPGPARADRADAARDDRPAGHRGRLRGRVRQRPAVQRHGARRVRDDPDAACATAAATASGVEPGRDRAAAGLPRSRSTWPRLLGSSALRAVPGVEEYDGTTYRRALLAAARPGRRGADPGRRPRARASCGSTTCATCRGRRPVPPAARPRRRPGRGRRRARRRPDARAAGRAPGPGCASPAPSTGPRWRSGRCSASRSRWPAPAARPARLVRRYGKPLTAPTGPVTHLFPTAGGAGRRRPRRAADAARPRARTLVGAGRAAARRRRSTSTPAPTATRPRRALLALPGIGPWTAAYLRCGRWATRTRSCRPTSASGAGSKRLGVAGDPTLGRSLAEALAALAVVRIDAPVGPRATDTRRITTP